MRKSLGMKGLSVSREGVVTLFDSIIEPYVDSRGYLRVNPGDKRRDMLVSRMVASVYIGDVRGKDVHHKDRNKHNNHADNLLIVARDEHKLLHEDDPIVLSKEKTMLVGDNEWMSSSDYNQMLKESEKHERASILSLLSDGNEYTCAEINNATGISSPQLRVILKHMAFDRLIRVIKYPKANRYKQRQPAP